MAILLLFLVLALNFIISWANASYVGRYWTESKEVGGSFRVYIIIGYIMAIAGFTAEKFKRLFRRKNSFKWTNCRMEHLCTDS